MIKKHRWEMILKWDSPKVPFQYQKLGFHTEKSLFKYAVAEAELLRALIIKVGNHTKKQCQIIAVAKEKALKQQENVLAKYVENHHSAIKKVMSEAKELNKKSKAETKPKTKPKTEIRAKTISLRG